jgi:hypothetical protein
VDVVAAAILLHQIAAAVLIVLVIGTKKIMSPITEEGFHKIAYKEWGEYFSELPTVICVI